MDQDKRFIEKVEKLTKEAEKYEQVIADATEALISTEDELCETLDFHDWEEDT